MSTHDKNGRPWANLSKVKAGDKLIADGGFDCLFENGGTVLIKEDISGLYFDCKAGKHHISGQADDGEHLVGLYEPEIV